MAGKKHRIWKAVVFILLAAVLALLLDSNIRIVCTEYEMEFKDLPQSFDGFRIVQLSDLHEKTFGKDNDRLLSKVAEAEPDLIAVTGDMVDRTGEDEYITGLISRLAEIAPVYYVSGNHEWASGSARPAFTSVTEAGGTVLRNKYITLERNGEEIFLAGIDDPCGPYDMKQPSELSDEMDEAGGDMFSILLAHRNNQDTYRGLTFNVVLCGHAHGGIIRLPVVGALLGTDRKLFPKYTSGVYDLDGSSMIVSRGLGNGTVIPRFLNNPEIPVIILRSAKE